MSVKERKDMVRLVVCQVDFVRSPVIHFSSVQFSFSSVWLSSTHFISFQLRLKPLSPLLLVECLLSPTWVPVQLPTPLTLPSMPNRSASLQCHRWYPRTSLVRNKRLFFFLFFCFFVFVFVFGLDKDTRWCSEVEGLELLCCCYCCPI